MKVFPFFLFTISNSPRSAMLGCGGSSIHPGYSLLITKLICKKCNDFSNKNKRQILWMCLVSKKIVLRSKSEMELTVNTLSGNVGLTALLVSLFPYFCPLLYLQPPVSLAVQVLFLTWILKYSSEPLMPLNPTGENQLGILGVLPE